MAAQVPPRRHRLCRRPRRRPRGSLGPGRHRGQVLTAGDYLSAYVLEWTLHHLDLVAHLPNTPGPPAESLAAARALLERIAGAAYPPGFSDKDALLVGTGRRAPTAAEESALGELGARLPLVLG